jgi:radical SAM protein with 4Fe4S-binding SPASM domain
MNWPLVAQILDYCAAIQDFSFEFAINTNLSLLNRQMAEKLKSHGVKIATSLDGIGDANDAIRTTRGGKGTFSLILSKIELLESIGYPLDGFSITVTSKNFESVDTEIIDFAAGRGMTSLAFDFDLVGFSTIPVEDRVAKILRLKRYANALGIYFGGTWYSPFRKLMTISMLERSHAFCAAIEGRALVFNPDGSIKTCGYTTTQVGDMAHFDKVFGQSGGLARLAGDRFPGADPYCHGCMIEGPCGGQCHSTWEAARRGSMDLFEQMCVFYRSVTDALIRDYLSALDDPEALELRVRYL